MSEEKKGNAFLNVIKSEYKRFFIVALGSCIYALGLIWFLQPAKLYSGGITGLVQLIVNIIEKNTGETISIGILIFLINIPILIIAFKFISTKFALYSLLSIIIQSTLTLGFIKVPDFGIAASDNLIMAFLGGCMVGIGGAIALRAGASTGGIDVFAQALSLKKNISIGNFSLIFNVSIALIAGGIFGWAIALYTIVRIITTSLVTDKIHTAYNHLKIEIITDDGEEISSMILREFGRGVTMLNGEGAYTHKKKYVLEVVVSSFELYKLVDLTKEIDPHVFIIACPVKRIVGNFKRRTVA
ncbi:MAG: YitT family protein [Eubacteriales bacterium]